MIFPGLSSTDKLKIDTVQSTRGSIYDRNGKLLAGEGKMSSVGIVPGKMNKNSEGDIQRIAELLNLSVDTVKNAINASYVKADTFVQLANISENDTKVETELLRIAGIKIKSSTGRIYPYGEDMSHLIGYVRKITTEELQENLGKGYNSNSLIRKSRS